MGKKERLRYLSNIRQTHCKSFPRKVATERANELLEYSDIPENIELDADSECNAPIMKSSADANKGECIHKNNQFYNN